MVSSRKRVLRSLLFSLYLMTIIGYANGFQIEERGLQFRLNGGFRVTSMGSDFTEVEFTLPDYDIIPVEIDGIVYYRLAHPESGYLMNEGLPELINFSTVLSIPNRGSAEIEEVLIKESQTKEGIKIFPSQGFDLEIAADKGFLINNDFYAKDVSYPDEEAAISSPSIMRDLRLVSLSVNPFIYNPVREELTIASKLTVRVKYKTSLPSENELETPRKRSRSFEPLYRGTALNYEQFRNPDDEYQQRSILVIHNNTTDPQFLSIINQFVEWKRDKGFEITATSTAGMTTTQQIKNYILNAYNTWEHPPEYVVMVGGKSGSFSVPVWTIYDSDAYIPGNSDGDHPYSTLIGDDVLPEVFIGRLSISSVEQLATAWTKIRNYERIPYFEENNNWYNHNLLVGDAGVSGISTVITSKYLKELMLRHNSNKTFAEVYSAPFATQMKNGINQGVAYFSFRGLENMAGWSAPSDGDLYNGLKLPHITVLTCRTVDFIGGKQIGRLYRMGTPANPKGIITGVGMSWVTETAFNNCVNGGIFYSIFSDGIRTMGEATVSGKLNLWKTYSNSHGWQIPRYFHQANLIGDPSMDIWVGTPESLNVSYPQTLPPGSNSVKVVVTDSQEQPVKNAWVTIRQGDDVIFETGYTDETGSITHFIDKSRTGEVKLTVTKPEYIPHLGSFNISGTAAVSFHNIVTQNQLNAGNNVNMIVTVKNHRPQTVNGVNGVIETDSDYINIISGNSSYGNIAANSTKDNVNDLAIGILSDVPQGHKAYFTLILTDNAQNRWESRFSLTVNNGDLQPVNIVIDDGNNGILDPDEEAVLKVYLKNEGNVNLQGIRGTISGGGYGLSFLNDTAFFGTINSGQTVTSSQEHFAIQTANYPIPGMIYDLTLTLENEAGFYQEHIIKIPIGSPTINDPLGPDAYGYWCYDSGDVGYDDAPTYEWLEIATTAGGNGTDTELRTDFHNLQQTIVMDLPFTFRFYGVEYDVVSICGNGWISFGPTEQATQRNWRLPGPLVPGPVVAAFWDNLSIGAGGVYTKYDEVNSKFIIQWHNARNVIGNAEETFQIILFNPDFYHTATADGPIKIQYKVFNNLNNGANTPTGIGNWGNYCTVGIADHTAKRGLEYTFNNIYPTAARPITHASAIYFTTGSVANAPYVAIEDFSFDDDNDNRPEYGERGTLNMTLKNIGGQDAENVTALLSSDDEYVDIIENNAQFGDIPSQEMSAINNAYTIEIASNTPNEHRIFFNLNVIEANNIDWNFRFYLTVNAPYIVIDTLAVSNKLEFGETVNVDMKLLNNGDSGSRNVTAILKTDDEYITITDNRALFGGIDVNEAIDIPRAYTFRIADDVPDLHRAQFTLSITSDGGQNWEDNFHLDFRAPVLASSTPTIYDPFPGGNNDGMIDPGETVTLFLPIINQGGANAPAVIVNVESDNELVTVNSITPTSFNTISSGLSMYPAVNVTLSDQAENGTPLTFYYTYETGAYLFSGDFLLGVGGVIPIQIGDGNAETSNQTASPINIYFKSLRSQAVYTAQELYDEGLTIGGRIIQLGYYVTTSPQYPLRNFQVRMKHTDAVNVAEHIEGPYEPVYFNENYTPQAGGWAMIPFSEPFEWNGVDNIIVDTAFAPVSGWGSSGQVRIFNEEDGFRYVRADNVDQTDVATTTTSPDKPQVTLLFGVDVGALAARPQNLTVDFDEEEVSLNWFAPSRDGEMSSRRRSAAQFERGELGERSLLGYNVYRNGNKVNATLVKEVRYSDRSFNPRIENFYYVTAVYSDFQSQASNIVRVRFDVVATPDISPASPTQYESFMVSLATNTDDSVIYYTLDGSDPTIDNLYYQNPFELNYHTTVKVRAFKDDWVSSEIAAIDYYVLYAPQNIRSTGTLSSAIIYWDEPWSPDQFIRRTVEKTSRRAANRSSQHNQLERLSNDMFGYYVYKATDEEDFVLLTFKPIESLQYEDVELEEGTYRYYVKAVYDKGLSQATKTAIVNVGTTDIEADEQLPLLITKLFNAYPNPFNPETTINFTLKEEGTVTIEVYNIIGKKIKTIVNESFEAGRHQVAWKGDDGKGNRMGSGIYFYKMTAPDYSDVKKMLLLK